MTASKRCKRAVIAEALRARVADQTYAPGSKLPRQEEFAAEFACSITPVMHAFGEMEASGTAQHTQGRVKVSGDRK
ncbi:MAG: GntR family transcriptional regulator [Streptosporangiaceae bacterium]|nr:GntR family transcriptional regulator [Streptosporangiaceae bacterium]